MRAELFLALVRSLPKAVRRGLGPGGDHVRAFVETCAPGDGPLLDVLAAFLAPRAATAVRASDFDPDRVAAHLRQRFRVIGADVAPELVRTAMTSWDVGALPRVVRSGHAGAPVTAYPALVDEGATVGVRLFPIVAEQGTAMWAGTRRLLVLTTGVSRKAVQRRLGNETALALSRSDGGGGIVALLDDCITAAVDRLLGDAGGPAWDEAAFAALRRGVGDGLLDAAVRAATIAGGVLATVQTVEDRLARLTAPSVGPAVADVRAQLVRLVPPGFVVTSGARRLPDVLRYVRRRPPPRTPGRRPGSRPAPPGAVRRVEADYEHLLETLPAERGAELGVLHWQLEELRVATFAQSLGTKAPVSETRIRKELVRLAGGA